MTQVIDLNEIQARIDRRQDVCAPTSRANSPQSTPRKLVALVWQLMGSLYGHRWTSAYGDEVDPDRVWAATLYGVTEDQIRAGLRACVDRKLEWPPTAPEFRGLCLPEPGWERRQIEAADAEWRSRALPPPRDEALAKREISKMREALGIRRPAP